MNLNIVFENDLFLVLDKPAGLVVNRSETTREQTLQDQLSDYFNLKNSDLGIGNRAGIVHRLDRETSGLLVVAKTQKSFDALQAQFKNREVEKTYVALVHGFLGQDKGYIKASIARIGRFGKFGVIKPRHREEAGRKAMTDYERILNFKFRILNLKNIIEQSNFNRNRVKYLRSQGMDYSLVEFYPKTGRTHQIRVHAKHIGHPVVSDLIYTPAKLLKFDLLWCPRLFLHAAKIDFADPVTRKRLKFESDLPSELKNAMLYLNSQND